jgi:hypothetical protein
MGLGLFGGEERLVIGGNEDLVLFRVSCENVIGYLLLCHG